MYLKIQVLISIHENASKQKIWINLRSPQKNLHSDMITITNSLKYVVNNKQFRIECILINHKIILLLLVQKLQKEDKANICQKISSQSAAGGSAKSYLETMFFITLIILCGDCLFFQIKSTSIKNVISFFDELVSWFTHIKYL